MIHRLLFVFACTGSALSAEDILLRLAPDPEARIIARLDATHEAITKAQAEQTPELAAAGWYQTELEATVTGYIRTEQLTKDFSIRPGTLIRATPEIDARVLSVIEASDHIEVDTTRANARWTPIRFHKAVLVYYRETTLPETSAIATAQTSTPQLEQEEKVIWKRVEIDTIYDPQPFEKKRRPSTTLVRETIPVTQPAPQDLPASLIEETKQTERSAPRRPQSSSDTSAITLRGKLTREYAEGSPYSLQLQSPDSPRTYLDLSKVFINDLRPFLDQSVQIQGILRPLVVGSEEQVLQVHEIIIAE